MSEVISPLSEDERTILMLASAGNSMIPIGRWEKAVKDLARRGFLEMLDSVNYVITDAGYQAGEAAERAADDDYRKAVGNVR